MNSLSLLFFTALLITLLVIAVASTEVEHNGKNNYDNFDEADQDFRGKIEHHHYFNGKKRPRFDHIPHFTWSKKPRAIMTCDKHPNVCRARWSPGPDCCDNRCVNVKTDIFNCGRCGSRCQFPEVCCNGECVNLMTDSSHCGSCYAACTGGSTCIYGMCNYA